MDITRRSDFKIFWDTLVAVLQTESVKKIRFDIASRFGVHRAASKYDLIAVYPDVLVNHIDKVEVDLKLDNGFKEETFTYGQSDELKMSDFAKKFNGVYSIC